MDLTDRPPRRSVMARWRAANASCMGASVVRPLAVAHGGHSSRTEEGKKALGAVEACPPDREWSDQLSGRFQRRLSDQLSEKAERSTVGSHQGFARRSRGEVRARVEGRSPEVTDQDSP